MKKPIWNPLFDPLEDWFFDEYHELLEDGDILCIIVEEVKRPNGQYSDIYRLDPEMKIKPSNGTWYLLESRENWEWKNIEYRSD